MDKHIADHDGPRLEHTDLYIYQCGAERCQPGHFHGPAVRDHFLIHYIHKGKGIFRVGDTTWHLKEGNGFLICPDILTYYQTDTEDPWWYSWVGFHGLKAETYLTEAGLTAEHPIFEYTEDGYIGDCFHEMADAYFLKYGNMRRMAYLYLFLHKLMQINTRELYYNSKESRHDAYINDALQFVETNYSRKITVDMISNYVGLNRSYLNSIFKEALGKTLQQYLMEFRVRKACELLENSSLQVGDISHSVGYSDQLLFSKVFKRMKGVTPTEYRKSLQQ
ncbi:MAG: AraC family transcriptional regulator [Lachnospiraceae bacterium]|nr:AraC family transcriptional regulator [Lachnospiraceae bacterium]